MNIRRAEHSHAVHVSFILEARGRSEQKLLTCRKSLIWTNAQAIAVAELNKKQKRFY